MTTALRHEAEVASRFDAVAGRFRREVEESDYRFGAVTRGLAGLSNPLVLDLGCGKGRFARRLAARGARVVGLDISRAMLSEGRGLRRVLGSARRLPFASGTFDAVVAVETFQHIRDVADTIAEARRVLRPGGRLLVVDRNAGALDTRRPWLAGLLVKWIDERRGLWMYPAGGPVQERWFWPRGLARLLAVAFEEVAVELLLSPDEAKRRVFRSVPSTRKMALWTARVPGRGE
ncbi:MAG TPA: class I SAM-dependent methyltransferase [Isosphaeraceae bacterium]|jgi:SAM-dependent methyltransferase